MAVSLRMKAMIHRLGVVLAAGLLSQCASNSSKGKETYGGILPGIHAPETLNYSGQTFTPGYSAMNKNGVVVEYYPAGQDAKQWNQMLALRLIEKPTSPQIEVVTLAAAVSNRGGSSHTHQGKSSADQGIDFAIPKGSGTEFNMYRYTQAGPTMTSLQYAAVLPPQTVQLGSPAIRAVAVKHSSTIMRMEMPGIARASGGQ